MGQDRGMLLIVDDEEMNKVLLSRRLRREGYSTMDAGDGFEVLNKLRELPRKDFPLMILMDINMPRMDGIQVTQILKHEYQNLPIIAVSAGFYGASDLKAFGFDEFCPKPIDFQELMAKIQRLLVA